MRERIDHARVTWMPPAWQTATFRQLLGMLVISSFLNLGLGQGDPITHSISPGTDTWVLAAGWHT